MMAAGAPSTSPFRPRNLALAAGMLLMIPVLLFPIFLGRWRIPQAGMFPTYPAGARIVGRKILYGSIADVRRGDIVIYRTKRDGRRTDFIWRVVGLPGERVALHADAVVVNGRELPRRPVRQQDGFAIFEETAESQSYEIALPVEPDGNTELAEVTVPPEHLFLLGDNRHNAADSRSSGPVPFNAVIARAIW